MYLTISKFKQILRSRKGLDYNTDVTCFPQNVKIQFEALYIQVVASTSCNNLSQEEVLALRKASLRTNWILSEPTLLHVPATT